MGAQPKIISSAVCLLIALTVLTCHGVRADSPSDLGAPNMQPDEIIAWAARVTPDVMTFDYKNADAHFDQAQGNFTPDGWKNFHRALDESQIPDVLNAQKLRIEMKMDGAPEITSSSVSDGIYTWMLQFPTTLRFAAAAPDLGDQPPQPISTTLLLKIVRSSSPGNADGIGIAQWVTLPPQ